MPSLNELFRKVSNLEKYIKSHVESNSKTNQMNDNEFNAARENTSKAQRSADQANEQAQINSQEIISAEQVITDMDLQNIETEQMLTDMDLRIMELEG